MHPHRTAPRSLDHVPALDGLRGIAILLVLVYHFQLKPLPGDASLVGAVADVGWLGVDLFFVLSGYLITRILVATRADPHYFRTFYVRRILRIWPLYYLCLAVLISTEPMYGRLDSLLPWYVVLAPNVAELVGGPPNVLGVAWSLGIEEQFYLLWPLAVRRVRPERLWRLSLALLATAPVLRATLLVLGVAPVAVYALPFTRMDSLAVGAGVALLPRPQLDRGATAVFVIGLGVLLGTAVSAGGLASLSPAMQTYGYTVAALCFGAVLLCATRGAGQTNLLPRLLSARLLCRFGQYAYGIYLTHVFVRPWLALLQGPLRQWTGSSLAAQALYYALAIPVVFGIGALSWHLLEARVLSLKRFAPYAPTPAPAARYSPSVRTT